MTVQQVEELRLERGAGTVRVEIGEERVLRFLEDDAGIEPRGEAFGERGLARADRPLDGDVAEVHAGR